MGLYERYATDEKLEAEGTWVDFGDGVRLKVISDQSEPMRQVRRRQQKKYRNYLVAMDVPDHIERAMQVEQACTAVIAWEGVTDRTGAPLPFTRDHLRQVMTDLRELRRDVLFAAGSAETFRPEEVVDAMGKTSAEPSSATSPSAEAAAK
jgi:hypothetical protein